MTDDTDDARQPIPPAPVRREKSPEDDPKVRQKKLIDEQLKPLCEDIRSKLKASAEANEGTLSFDSNVMIFHLTRYIDACVTLALAESKHIPRREGEAAFDARTRRETTLRNDKDAVQEHKTIVFNMLTAACHDAQADLVQLNPVRLCNSLIEPANGIAKTMVHPAGPASSRG